MKYPDEALNSAPQLDNVGGVGPVWRANTEQGIRAFLQRVVPVWNALPEHVVLSDSYAKFCSKLQTIDLSLFLKRTWDDSQILD